MNLQNRDFQENVKMFKFELLRLVNQNQQKKYTLCLVWHAPYRSTSLDLYTFDDEWYCTGFRVPTVIYCCVGDIYILRHHSSWFEVVRHHSHIFYQARVIRSSWNNKISGFHFVKIKWHIWAVTEFWWSYI